MLNLWGKHHLLNHTYCWSPNIPKSQIKSPENSEVRSQGPQPGLPLPSPQGTSQLLALREELQRLRNRVALVEGLVQIPEAPLWGDGTCMNIILYDVYCIYTYILYSGRLE